MSTLKNYAHHRFYLLLSIIYIYIPLLLHYYKQQSENSLFPHIEKIVKNTRIRISIHRTVKYLYVLIIHVKIPEKQVRPKNCRNRNPASQEPREFLFPISHLALNFRLHK